MGIRLFTSIHINCDVYSSAWSSRNARLSLIHGRDNGFKETDEAEDIFRKRCFRANDIEIRDSRLCKLAKNFLMEFDTREIA